MLGLTSSNSLSGASVISLLSQRERHGVVGGRYGGRGVCASVGLPDQLASTVAWNAQRMNDIILAVGPATPSALRSGFRAAQRRGHSERRATAAAVAAMERTGRTLIRERRAVHHDTEDDSDTFTEEIQVQVHMGRMMHADQHDDHDHHDHHDDEDEEDDDDHQDAQQEDRIHFPAMASWDEEESEEQLIQGGDSSSSSSSPNSPSSTSSGASSLSASDILPTKRLFRGEMPPPKSSMRHGGCINTASWLTAGWRVSLAPLGNTSSHNASPVSPSSCTTSINPHPLLTHECPTQLLTSGDDRTVKIWDASAAMGTASPSSFLHDQGLPEDHPHAPFEDATLALPFWSNTAPCTPVKTWGSSQQTYMSSRHMLDTHGTILPLVTMHTGHRGNVFHATPVPQQPGKIATCAADGFLNLSDVEHQSSPTTSASAHAARGARSASSTSATVVVSPEFGEEGAGTGIGFAAGRAGGLVLLRSGMCFSHHFLSPHTGLLCSERGLHRFDTRVSPSAQPARSLLASSHPSGAGVSNLRPHQCKACAVWRPPDSRRRRRGTLFDHDHTHTSEEQDDDFLLFAEGSTYVFAGGSSGDVTLHDLRMDSGNSGREGMSPSSGGNNRILQRYRPSDIGPDEVNSISVSGLDISRDGMELLVSYENDQIYSFPIFNANSPSSSSPPVGAAATRSRHNYLSGDEEDDLQDGQDENDNQVLQASRTGVRCRNGLRDSLATSGGDAETTEPVQEIASYGGHLNRYTFLKGARYAGPKDEYICTGSDSGHAWIYERKTGAVVSLLRADRSTCNGVVPHPTLPIFITYGIDSTAKLWRATGPARADADDSWQGRAKSDRYKPYQKSATVRKWKVVQSRLNLLDDMDDSGDGGSSSNGGAGGGSSSDRPVCATVLPDVIPPRGDGHFDPSSSAGGSHWLQYRRLGWGDSLPWSSSLASEPPGIGNNLRNLPALLRQNYYTCAAAVAGGDDEPVKSGLDALARRVSVAGLRHQADRLGLASDKDVPWIMRHRGALHVKAREAAKQRLGKSIDTSQDSKKGCHESDADDTEKSLLPSDLDHPADLVPDNPSDWLPYDVEMTPEPKRHPALQTGDDSTQEWWKGWVRPRSALFTEDSEDPLDTHSLPSTSRRVEIAETTALEHNLAAADQESDVVAPTADAAVSASASPPVYSDERAWEILHETVQVLKDGGNNALQLGMIQLAATRYDKAIRYCAIAFMTFPAGNLRFLEARRDHLTEGGKGPQIKWDVLFKTFITIRLNLSMAMLKPQIGDNDGAAEQARLAVNELKPFVGARGKIIVGQVVHRNDVPQTVYEEAKELQAKAYFRLGSAQHASKDYGGAVHSFEKSIQATREAKAGKPGVDGEGKPEPVVLRRLAEAKREHLKKKERHRKKFKSMFASTKSDESGGDRGRAENEEEESKP